MESEQFDTVVRRAFNDLSRRGVIRAGAGALVASVLTSLGLGAFEDAEAKKKKRKKKKKGKKPQQCTGNTPVTCGTGCCPTTVPTCCQEAYTTGFACYPPDRVCCPVEWGGGACRAAFETCCPNGPSAGWGSCAGSGEFCCDSDHSGGTCDTGEACCPSALFNFDNFGCCPTGKACCNSIADCAGCLDGCCP